MLKNVEYKSIFMGDSLRYVISANVDGVRTGKLLSVNESKLIHILNNKEKFQYAERILTENKQKISEGRSHTIKLFDVIWTQNGIKHHQRMKSVDERSAVDRVHSRGGSVVSLQMVN
jgi:hypothetical protein